MDIVTEVAVVGLGLIGSAALREMASGGVSCVGIGPAEPAEFATHIGAFASHYDSGRITRHLDRQRPWAVLAARAIADYAAIEAESGIRFHRPVGVVLNESDPVRIRQIGEVADELGVPMSSAPAGGEGTDARLRFPAGSTVLGERAPAGHVDPRRMLAANLVLAERSGARVMRTEVRSIRPGRDGRWRISLDRGVDREVDGEPAGDAQVIAERVLVATGAHTDELVGLQPLPDFRVRGETIVMATLGLAEQSRLEGLTSVLAQLDHPTYEDLYLVPATDYPDGTVRLKLGATLREPNRLDSAAARRDWMAGDAHRLEAVALQAFMEHLVVDLVADAWETRPCMITDTASGFPVVDHLAPGLVVAAGGNGYAAKSANAIGALASRLLDAGKWVDEDLDAADFAMPRA